MKSPRFRELSLSALSLIHIGLSFLISLVSLCFFSRQGAASLGAGATVIILNFWLLAGIWGLGIRFKKLIAFTFLIIVFKYLFLGTLILQLLQASWLRPLAFWCGMGVFVLSTLVYAGLHSYRESALQKLTL
jgi:hypothetical protein